MGRPNDELIRGVMMNLVESVVKSKHAVTVQLCAVTELVLLLFLSLLLSVSVHCFTFTFSSWFLCFQLYARCVLVSTDSLARADEMERTLSSLRDDHERKHALPETQWVVYPTLSPLRLIPSLQWCHLKTTHKCAKFEPPKFFVFLFCTGM